MYMLCNHIFVGLIPHPPQPTLFPYTTLFRSLARHDVLHGVRGEDVEWHAAVVPLAMSRGALDDRFVRRDPRLLARLRSEEHTSELQSHVNLVCRLLLEKKKSS